MNQTSWRFTWPFLVDSSAASAFFEPAMNKVHETLSNTAVLQTVSGAMKSPRDVFYVDPQRFSDSTGRPFTLFSRTEDIYVSAEYPLFMAGHILRLNTRNLAGQDFLKHLQMIITEDPASFYSRSSEWHGELAHALLPLLDQPRLSKQVARLHIVPLADKTWTSAEEKPLLYPKDIDFGGFDIRTIESIKLVNPAAEVQPRRLQLFRALGIAPADSTQICRIIQEFHSVPTLRPSSLTTSHLISHAKFLYSSSWAPAKDRALDLWFETNNGTYGKGSRLYISCTEPQDSPALARVMQQLCTRYRVLHQDYHIADNAYDSAGEKIDNGDIQESHAQDHFQIGLSGFMRYLVKHCGLAAIPRLVTTDDFDYDTFRLSDEFTYLAEVCRSSDLVQVLMDNWNHYSEWIEPDLSRRRSPKWKVSREKLIRAVQNTSLVISDGSRVRLDEIVLSGLDPLLDDAETSLPVLDYEAGDETIRSRLSLFGILAKKDLDYYIRCLKSMRSCNPEPQTRILAYIYGQIQAHYDSEPRRIE